ncbi:MAG: type ISP restriction/modification enzyme [Candidatus Nitrosoabyssus spongiisocia]|nr:MAG: type ISP restriction/modification enzyme [Nitrosopumilaceae archaeon AB1(1)]
MTQTFETILSKIRKESKNTVELGTKFEKLTKDFLTTDKHYANRFEKIWLWKEYPKNDGHDTGIDIVAKERVSGNLCAIQCKCYADDGTLDMKSVSTFLAKAASMKMKNKMLVYTGDNITDHAQKVTKDSKCTILRKYHLLDSSIEWNTFPKLSVKNPKTLRPHQQIAVKDVLHGLSTHDRGKMIMACGTGKTLASLHIAEQQVGKGGIILYLVPSISLILQSMRQWSENATLKHYYLAVCSDKSTGEDGFITELESPVSTDYQTLSPYLKSRPKNTLTVIFSTYHSIDVVRKTMGKQSFDLILCDEAHRTTGVEDKSFFTIVHKNSNINAKKRLYMTATPRVYSDVIQAKFGKVIYSMDDEEKYGPEFHKLSFTDAVKQKILADFKVKIAIVPADVVDKDFQQSVADKDNSIPLDERTLLAAVWHGLKYPDDDKHPKLLQRVIAFANRIDRSMMFAGKITDGNDVNRSFANVVKQYEEKKHSGFGVDVEHVDGKTKALERRDKLRWLDESTSDPNTCRILSNARCLAEGVDVPALDGVIFLNPRKSRVDVVQSVGRVMRKSKNKDFGYVILPVAIPAGIEKHEALNDNKTFKVVWQVLNALRSHDEDFGSEINTLILDKRTENTNPTPRISVSVLDDGYEDKEIQTKFFDKVKSKLVEKVGDINYYDKYGQTIGQTAHTIQVRIRNKMKSNGMIKQEIQKFHSSLQIMINDSVTEEATVQVISQHMVLSRVFDVLFQGEFTSYNPISISFDKMIKKIKLDEELEELKDFYNDVRNETRHITTRAARQDFIKKIYGNFFESIDKKNTEQHGIVFTPVEIVDFIIHSTQHLCKKHFDVEFNDKSVKILEPFAGTGTFITRLLESGLITSNIYEKYKHDLYANELILLAYYIATINIETTYSSLRKGRYVPFSGMTYTDTLRINPKYRQGKYYRQESSTLDDTFKVAHERIRNQRGSHIHIIIGNPPYSAGQSNYNNQSPNVLYPEIDNSIKNTYAKKTTVSSIRTLHDSYIRSLRWASDRIGKSGIIAFVTNASFLKSNTAAGVRASLEEEFNEIWCFDLKGNQRTQGELSKKEGGKIFGSGSRAPVAITILVKNPAKKGCTIHYKDIGNYYNREKKLEMIKNAKSIQGIKNWVNIIPDKHHDWIEQRNDTFSNYTSLGTKNAKSGKSENVIFQTYCLGVATGRDVWTYNSSKSVLTNNMQRHINYCNKQGWNKKLVNPKQAKWTEDLVNRLKKTESHFDKTKIRLSLYRPFFKQYLYFDRVFNNRVFLIPKFFPDKNSKNLLIIVPDKFIGEFSTSIVNMIPDLEVIHHAQCFPLYIYEKNGNKKFNITNYMLNEYQNFYNNVKITKIDIFYYIYGILHHTGYRKKFAANLIRELPHIPLAPEFKKFSDVGKRLAELHLNFDTCKRYNLGKPKNKFDGVKNLRFKTKKEGKKRVKDTTVLQINKITVFDNIPNIQYTVNGRTPLEWIVDRYKITADKDSGIVNDPCSNVDMIPIIERAVYVGIESDKIIQSLPKEFEPEDWRPKKTGLDEFNGTTKSTQSML